MTPRATYRLQFSKDFNFDDAAAIAEYLRALGVSHIYASPWLRARPGTKHGYDVTDPNSFDPELGGEAGFGRLAAALHTNQLGHILDFVPNHLGVGGADNCFWLDVLEWGPSSQYADWFDINWTPQRADLREKLLVPFLGNQYGVELQRGYLRLAFEESEGSFAVWAYGTHKLPICPIHYGSILRDPELAALAEAFTRLTARHESQSEAEPLKGKLASLYSQNSRIRLTVETSLARFTGVDAELDTWLELDELIQRQYWRPAHHRVASDDINYRRFFSVNDLAGIRMEEPAVFDHMHRLVLDLLKAGSLDGVRIDHVDGLFNPKQYLQRLRNAVDAVSDEPPYLVVEKILAHHEGLREEWPIDGSTGYDFLNQVLGLLIDPAGEEGLTRAYQEFSGEGRGFTEIASESKLEIIENEMAGELAALAAQAAAIARQNPRTTDFTQNVFVRALKQIVACFPVYRTYVTLEAPPAQEEDRRYLQWALEQARVREINIDPSVFDFLGELLSTELAADPKSGFNRDDVVKCAMRFQQYTVSVMAKGVEDTAFYRYNRFLALNEVGGRPDQFGMSLNGLHRANAFRQKRWPHSLLATSTHDTKLGEDVRARLAVLSEIPEEWSRQVSAWSRILRAPFDGTDPDSPVHRNDEYRFYQLLLGAWPADLTLPNEIDSSRLSDYAARMNQAMLKSIREAKVRTSWIAPNSAYENAVTSFVEKALDADRSKAFLSLFRPFQERVARLGVENSLVQTVLKLTAPGVPDIYQGAELWELSFMDPDNRRGVDFRRHRHLLESNSPKLGDVSHGAELLASWHNGAVKLHVLEVLLRFRCGNPGLFSEGTYRPVFANGPRAEHIFAFTRQIDSGRVLVLCARFPAARESEWTWDGTMIPFLQPDPQCGWTDVLSNNKVPHTKEGFEAAAVFRHLPVAVLVPACENRLEARS